MPSILTPTTQRLTAIRATLSTRLEIWMARLRTTAKPSKLNHKIQSHNNLGVALFKVGDVEDAIFNYERAIATNPGYKDAFNNLGVALESIGDVKSAMENYFRSINMDPRTS